MEWIKLFFDVVLHLDAYLASWVALYGVWIYVILFVVVFSETGFVVTPFLPGDSLLFVAGALSAIGEEGMNVYVLIATLLAAAILGNTLNYQIGRFLGPKVFQWENSRFFNKDALVKTHAFYEKHGGKTLIFSRFLPIFRTFAPFVAGVGFMSYARFSFFNIVGALSWVLSITLLGYFFGNIAWIRANLSLVIVLLVMIPFLPAAFAAFKHYRETRSKP